MHYDQVQGNENIGWFLTRKVMSDKINQSNIIGIRFQSLGKLYHFTFSDEEELKIGDFVIVTTSRGRELGEIVQVGGNVPKNIRGSLKPIERRASPQDLVMSRFWQRREVEALMNCREKTSELGLKGIKITQAEFSYDGSRLSFLYSSEGNDKKEMEELRRVIQRNYRKSKVELREVGPRDVAKAIGGMGACGLEERCCSRFMTEFCPISIRMAKAQGISLNPQEITGMCGRLRCCLIYEYEQYVEARKKLPKKNKRVVTPLGEGKVVDVVPLKSMVIVALDDGLRSEFPLSEIHPYEELKALKDKANQPCEKGHRNGNGGDESNNDS
jgi:cell fate regulator YaaT (PSP1 superfamily)